MCLFGRASYWEMHFVTASDKSINEIINVGSFQDSLVSLLQPLDLPLQFKVVGATRRHPTEEQKGGEEEEEELLMKSEKKVVNFSSTLTSVSHFWSISSLVLI